MYLKINARSFHGTKYIIWCLVGIFRGLLLRTFDKVTAKWSFSQKYCSAVAKSYKPCFLSTMKSIEYTFGV